MRSAAVSPCLPTAGRPAIAAWPELHAIAKNVAMFPLELSIRPSDCDTFGHVNNAVYIDLLHHCFAQTLLAGGFAADWQREGEHSWCLHRLSAEYRQATLVGDRLRGLLWLEGSRETELILGFEVQANRQDAGPVSVFRSRSEWQRVHRLSREATTLPEELVPLFSREAGAQPKPLRLSPTPEGLRSYTWIHQVTRTECGPDGFAHPKAIYHWLEEALFDASDQGGWPHERRVAANFLTFQARHDSEFRHWPALGDRIEITSRLVDVRRFRGTWLHQVHRLPERTLLLQDYSTGIFLDLEGKLASGPAEMMQELQFGVSASSEGLPPPRRTS
ncbi:MAG: acyl-CoA thioesterase [Caldilineae bacterium]|nr:MAG: acyl-CoA thioesterase [Caldilineae bacterium]